MLYSKKGVKKICCDDRRFFFLVQNLLGLILDLASSRLIYSINTHFNLLTPTSPDEMSLRSSNPSQASLRLMTDLKEVKTEPPEVLFVYLKILFFY